MRSTTRLTVGARLAVLVIAIGAAGGCTMCPDPFDYSGPVPNGSTPQNDFRARSGGIFPVGAAPRPWPQVVRAEGGEAEDATAGGEKATVETVSVLRPAAAVTGDEGPLVSETEGAPAREAPEPALEPVPADGPSDESAAENAAAAPEPPSPGVTPAGEPVASTPLLSASETPGWRPRR